MSAVVQELPLPVLVDLVNGWGSVPRAAAGEDHLPHPPLGALSSYQESATRGRRRLTDEDVRRVADWLYPVFAESAPDRRADLVNALLEETGVRPSLAAESGAVHAACHVDDPHSTLLAAATIAGFVQLANHDASRLGTCTGKRCADVFVDTSPAGHRRYCSVTCQNRARVAAFRQRQSH